MRRSDDKNNWLIVDGYNVIGAWHDMRDLTPSDLEDARDRLADKLLNYCGHTGQHLVLVFDAHSTKEALKEERMTDDGKKNIVIFTAYGQTADNYIERFVRKHSGEKMTVASSDALLQVMVLEHSKRISSRELGRAIEDEERKINQHQQEQYEHKGGLAQALRSGQFEALNALRYEDSEE